MKTQELLGISFTDASQEEVLEYVLTDLITRPQKAYIVTPNPEIIMYASSHPSFKKILNEADIALPDGVGVILAAKLLGIPLKHRITGTDFMENLCKESVRKGVSIGLLGGKPGVAEATAKCLQKKYPGITIVFAGAEWDPAQSRQAPLIDILFVAFGHPKQEEWIARQLPDLPVKVAMGVGGAFDYLSGQIPRAPKLFRTLGLEWLFRLIRQPWRWRRQLSLLEFIFAVIKRRVAKR